MEHDDRHAVAAGTHPAAGWDDRPCGYLLFGPPYDRMAQQARQRGWDVDHVPGGHLHQLVDPDAVAARLIALTR